MTVADTERWLDRRGGSYRPLKLNAGEVERLLQSAGRVLTDTAVPLGVRLHRVRLAIAAAERFRSET